jgi:putative oxidoreductase
MQAFFSTDPAQWGLFILRVVLGLVILPHGAQKLFGWFGGYGFKGTMGFFTGTLHIPTVAALLVIAAESFGALGLVFGLFTRLAALGIAAVMLGAAYIAHRPNGFFMNWSGQQKGEGFEYHLLAVGMALVLIVYGGGALSLDAWLPAQFGG